VVQDNLIMNSPYGIYLLGNESTEANISGNEIINGDEVGIYLNGLTEISSILYNNITNNNMGIYINSGYPTINNNNLLDNSEYGIYNNNSQEINATNNYWGDSSGPYHPSINPDGIGDEVSNNVIFNPWLIQPFDIEDCAGVLNGEAFIDDCDICSGGTSGHEPNSDMDCAGVCFGDNYVDECGICDNNPINDNVMCSGCTDSGASNYCDECTIDDGSCEYDNAVLLTFGDINYVDNSIEILMANPIEIAGFQFVVEDISDLVTITEAIGGRAEEAGFEVTVSQINGVIMGFSFTGSLIPSGEGVLTNLIFDEWNETELCIVDDYFTQTNGLQLFVEIGSCIDLACLGGDVNSDNAIDVIDIVFLVSIIMGEVIANEWQSCAGDVNSDGNLNVGDIVQIVQMILSDNSLSKNTFVDKAKISIGNGNISIQSDGTIAGLELGISGEFEFQRNNLPISWEIYKNSEKLLIFSIDGSQLKSETLFEYTGNLVIETAFVADWLGNIIYADIQIIPDQFSLKPAYPNPFNPVTTISYSLPTDASVSLYVYDIAGREVAELIYSNSQQIAGNYAVEFNATDLSSGIYFVMMRAKSDDKEFISKQKVVLLK